MAATAARVIRARLRAALKTVAAIDRATSGDALSVAAVADKAHFVVGYSLLINGVVRVEFESAATDKHVINAAEPMVGAESVDDEGDFLIRCAENEALSVAIDQSIRVTGWVAYKTIDISDS